MTLIFLKLGGSLITEKAKPRTARANILKSICAEISLAIRNNPTIKLIIGHGSGSFGHFPAKKYNTKNGVYTLAEWEGFFEVQQDARALHLLILDELKNHQVRAISFPPSSCVFSENRVIKEWNLSPIRSAMNHNFVPVIYGDVTFDDNQGATILSTEDLFFYLAKSLRPSKVLLAGLNSGIYADFPLNTKLIKKLTRKQFATNSYLISESEFTDVTGGMADKVEIMFNIIDVIPNVQINIFSGFIPGNIIGAFQGKYSGTILSNE